MYQKQRKNIENKVHRTRTLFLFESKNGNLSSMPIINISNDYTN